eukprot:scaffold5291_cov188-Prasinococcus_capsulatus_cf.AAC.1
MLAQGAAPVLAAHLRGAHPGLRLRAAVAARNVVRLRPPPTGPPGEPPTPRAARRRRWRAPALPLRTDAAPAAVGAGGPRGVPRGAAASRRRRR